jgi:Fur family ferric uptake transcriptional regulator
MRYTQPDASRLAAKHSNLRWYIFVKVVRYRQMIDTLPHHTGLHSMPQRLKPTPTNDSNDLRNAGLKVTLPRLKILDILADGSARHMSAEDIYKKLLVHNEDIGLATVYRVLTQFEAAGLVTRHHFEGGMAVFELNQGAHHDHIVCVDCGAVEEFMDGAIEDLQDAVAKRLGFEISDHALILYGHCRKPNCPRQKRPKDRHGAGAEGPRG